MTNLERELTLKEEIRHRLESICSNLSPSEFQALIEKIAYNQLKGEYRPFRLGSATGLDIRAGNGKGPLTHPRRST